MSEKMNFLNVTSSSCLSEKILNSSILTNSNAMSLSNLNVKTNCCSVFYCLMTSNFLNLTTSCCLACCCSFSSCLTMNLCVLSSKFLSMKTESVCYTLYQ